MTIGERIQQYRKAQKLSQEELAGKLFVSRQTVSLWENDQTLPTIDNLIRLKEIFNISLDELLTGTDESPEISPVPEPSHPIDTAPPVEAYTFRYTRDELAAYFKTFNRKNGIVARIAVIPLLLVCIAALVSESIVPGIILGILALLLSLYSLVIFLRSRKGQLEALQKVPLRTYLYELYNDYMTVTISTTTDDELQSKWQVPYVAITQVWETDELLVLEYQKRIFFLRKRALSPYSQIHAPLASKVRHRWMTKPLPYKLAIALFVATLLSIWAALLCVAFASQFAADFSGNMWIFFLFLPFPIASLIVGILLRRKGFKSSKTSSPVRSFRPCSFSTAPSPFCSAEWALICPTSRRVRALICPSRSQPTLSPTTPGSARAAATSSTPTTSISTKKMPQPSKRRSLRTSAG